MTLPLHLHSIVIRLGKNILSAHKPLVLKTALLKTGGITTALNEPKSLYSVPPEQRFQWFCGPWLNISPFPPGFLHGNRKITIFFAGGFQKNAEIGVLVDWQFPRLIITTIPTDEKDFTETRLRLRKPYFLRN
eukprot:Gb_06541 [translate_table: standard]